MGFRSPRWLTPIKKAALSVRDLFPVTAQGFVIGCAALISWFVWVEDGHDFVIRAVIVSLAVTILVCILATFLSALVVLRSVKVPPKPLIGDWQTGETYKTGFEMPRLTN